jgi:methylated-DNA-protein-cysteine methyltransferase-like protein
MPTKARSIFDPQVYQRCREIPSGRVTTYGRLAAMIPPPPGIDPLGYDRVKARWVGYALSKCPADVPWHRVLNARGESSLRPGQELQRALLEEEGVRFDAHGRVDLDRFLWDGSVPATGSGDGDDSIHPAR